MTAGSTLVPRIGNPILSDDRVGLPVAGRLAAERLPDGVEVRQSEVAGPRLLELVRGFTRDIIIDALKSPAEMGREPGEFVRYEAKDFRGGHRYGSAHSIGLGPALELGHRLGYDRPREVIVFAIEAEDVKTFGEELSPPASPRPPYTSSRPSSGRSARERRPRLHEQAGPGRRTAGLRRHRRVRLSPSAGAAHRAAGHPRDCASGRRPGGGGHRPRRPGCDLPAAAVHARSPQCRGVHQRRRPRLPLRPRPRAPAGARRLPCPRGRHVRVPRRLARAGHRRAGRGPFARLRLARPSE